MRNEADGIRAEGGGENSAFLEAGDEVGRTVAGSEPEDDDVGLDRLEVDGGTGGVGERLGQQPRVGVVFMEPLGALLQGDEPGCGQNART